VQFKALSQLELEFACQIFFTTTATFTNQISVQNKAV